MDQNGNSMDAQKGVVEPIPPGLVVRPRRVGAVAIAAQAVPNLILSAGEEALTRYVEFFTANIRNANTRRAYFRNASAFLRWCEDQGIADIQLIKPVVVAAYVEGLQATLSKPSVKQHLASIRMLFEGCE
jgi:hypothetical protein